MKLLNSKQLAMWLLAIVAISCNPRNSKVSEHPVIDSLYQIGIKHGGRSIDSLLVVAKEIYRFSSDYPEGQFKAKLLSGWHYLDKFKMDTSYQLLSAAERYFSGEDSTSFETGWSNSLLGVYFLRKSLFDSSEARLDKADRIFQFSGNRNSLAANYARIGNVYFLKGELPSALEFLLKSYSIKTQELNLPPSSYSFELVLISTIYLDMGQTMESMRYSRLGLAGIDKNSSYAVNHYNRIGLAHKLLGNTDSAEYYFNQSIAIGNNSGVPGLAQSAKTSLAEVYFSTGQFEKSKQLILELTSTISPHYGMGKSTYLILARDYDKLEKPDSAIFYARKSLGISKGTGDKRVAFGAADLLFELYYSKGILDSALHFLQYSYQTKDSLFNTENQKKLSSLYAEIETMKKQEEIDELKILNEVRRQEANLLLVVIIGGGVVALLSIVLLIQNHKYRQKKAQLRQQELEGELTKRNEELKLQAARMISMSNGIKEIEDSLKNIQKESAGNYSDVQGVLNSIKINHIMEKEWENFDEYFGSVHTEFYSKLSLLSSEFTIAEKRLASLIRMNMTNHEIASILNIETNSVKMAKYRLKKKLGLTDEQNISAYLSSL